MIDINYELYKVFYHVASTLNFSEASKQLFISQSAVSQSIKTLERKLDQVLFIRSTKKVQLTPEGEILMRHIEPAMNLIQRGEAQLLDAVSTGGQIRIGASDTICRYFLIPYLERFHKAFPNAHIKVINQTSLKCAELLKSGLVDQSSQPLSRNRSIIGENQKIPGCLYRRRTVHRAERPKTVLPPADPVSDPDAG